METIQWKFGQKQFSIQKFTKSQFTNFKLKIKFVFVSSASKSGSNDGVVLMEFNTVSETIQKKDTEHCMFIV